MQEKGIGTNRVKREGTIIRFPFVVGEDVYYLALVDMADDDREQTFHKEWVIRKKTFSVSMLQGEGKYFANWAEAYAEKQKRDAKRGN